MIYPIPPPRWARLKSALKFLSKPEWVNVVLTVVIAGTGVVGIILVIKSGQDTQKMVGASEKSAKAASDFATSAAAINRNVAATQRDFETMAKNSEAAIKATQESMRQDQRAWVGVTDVIPN